jgi:hypothetical protein
MFYTYSSSSFGESELPNVEEEARSFAEGLGAMLDEIHFSGLSREARNNWIDEQEMLNPRKREPEPAPVPETPVPEPAAAVQQAPAEPAPPAPAPQPIVQQTAPPAQPAAAADPVQPQPAAEATWQTRQPEQSASPSRATNEIRVPVDAEENEPPALQPQPLKKRAPLRDESANSEQSAAANSIEDVLEEAVRAGVVKAPKARLKKDIRTSTGSIGREKEALARLLSSF